MKRVLLIDPSYILNYHLEDKEFSVGLLTIGGFIKKNSQNQFVIDYFMPEGIDGMKFEEWLEYVKSTISDFCPDVIGCTTRCDIYPFILEFLEGIKMLLPQTLIILGGAQATHTDLQTLKVFPAIDFIVRGEGEVTFIELLTHIDNQEEIRGIPGITYRTEGGEIRRTTEREIMSQINTFPDYQTIYMKNNKAIINRIEAGRGCPYNCVFCSLCKMWNRKFRLLEAEQIIGNMSAINSISGCTYFALEHDNLLANKLSAEKFLLQLVELKNPYSWACSSRIDSIRKIDFSLLKEAGCKNIFFGIETGSAKMQAIYNKNIDVSLVYETLLDLNEKGINFTLSFVCGHPSETADDIEKTIMLCIKCKTLTHCSGIQIHKLSPLAGSKLLEDVEENIFLDDNSVSDQSDFLLYPRYKSIISENPTIFSSFYSIPLEESSKQLISSILADGINVINNFSRTLYYITDNQLIIMSELISLFENVSKFIAKVTELIFNEKENILKSIFDFEMELYKCHEKCEYQLMSSCNDTLIKYNSSQRLVETSNYVLNFNISSYREESKNSGKVLVRAWADYRTSAIKFTLFDNRQRMNMELCKNNVFIDTAGKEAISNLVKEGYLTKGGRQYE